MKIQTIHMPICEPSEILGWWKLNRNRHTRWSTQKTKHLDVVLENFNRKIKENRLAYLFDLFDALVYWQYKNIREGSRSKRHDDVRLLTVWVKEQIVKTHEAQESKNVTSDVEEGSTNSFAQISKTSSSEEGSANSFAQIRKTSSSEEGSMNSFAQIRKTSDAAEGSANSFVQIGKTPKLKKQPKLLGQFTDVQKAEIEFFLRKKHETCQLKKKHPQELHWRKDRRNCEIETTFSKLLNMRLTKQASFVQDEGAVQEQQAMYEWWLAHSKRQHFYEIWRPSDLCELDDIVQECVFTLKAENEYHTFLFDNIKNDYLNPFHVLLRALKDWKLNHNNDKIKSHFWIQHPDNKAVQALEKWVLKKIADYKNEPVTEAAMLREAEKASNFDVYHDANNVTHHSSTKEWFTPVFGLLALLTTSIAAWLPSMCEMSHFDNIAGLLC